MDKPCTYKSVDVTGLLVRIAGGIVPLILQESCTAT
jgi:hypothetical protein